MRKKLFSVIAIFTMLSIGLFPVGANASVSSVPIELEIIDYSADPVKAECWDATDGWELPEGTVPFNIDMVDAEGVREDGEGVYVAVLDTGLLSNYLDFFPAEMVDIKEEWGKGFTHDLIWVGTGGNWSEQFDYGPLRDDRGFITYDNGAPDKYGYGWGSGHGSHVTSIITGWKLERDQSFWVRGVAPKVTIIPVLVLDTWIEFNPDFTAGWFFRGGTNEMVAAGIQYIGDLARTHKIKIVINLSLGGSQPSDLIEEAINYAISNGVIVIASAGNTGDAGMGWPGAFPQVISCAAAGWTQEYMRTYLQAPDPWYWWTDDVPENLWTTDPLGNDYQVYLTDFSSRPNEELGQEPWHLDVTAPGAAVRGPYKPYGSTQWGYYGVWGTSQAAPHVSGTAALILEKYPRINQYAMETCLKISGAFNRLTKYFETERSAIIYDTFVGDLSERTWTYKDYGTGLLQADVALWIARVMFGRRYR